MFDPLKKGTKIKGHRLKGTFTTNDLRYTKDHVKKCEKTLTH